MAAASHRTALATLARSAIAFARALDGYCQAVFLDRLQQIVERLQAERFDRVLIVGGGHHKVGQRHALRAQLFDDAHAVEARHLHIQENQVGLQVGDQLHGF